MNICQSYYPDRTFNNVWRILFTKKSKQLVLTSKACTRGVTPLGDGFRIAAFLLSKIVVGCILCLLFLYADAIAPKAWTPVTVKACGCVIIVITYIITVPISYIVTLRVSKWIPVEQSMLSKGSFSD